LSAFNSAYQRFSNRNEIAFVYKKENANANENENENENANENENENVGKVLAIAKKCV